MDCIEYNDPYNTMTVQSLYKDYRLRKRRRKILIERKIKISCKWIKIIIKNHNGIGNLSIEYCQRDILEYNASLKEKQK